MNAITRLLRADSAVTAPMIDKLSDARWRELLRGLTNYGSHGAGEVGHVFNAVNQNGTIRFLDGQIGGAASFEGYVEFFFLRTFQGEEGIVMTKTEVTQIALDYIKRMESGAGCELILLDSKILERQFGWVFFYDSRRHTETGEFRHALAGNAPIVVTRHDGKIHETGTALPLEEYFRQFGGDSVR